MRRSRFSKGPIGHMKRNHLKGPYGNDASVVFTAIGYNFRVDR